jgi:hypothetical protein
MSALTGGIHEKKVQKCVQIFSGILRRMRLFGRPRQIWWNNIKIDSK